jgi:hypothetical protein
LENITDRLQVMDVLVSHPIPPSVLEGKALTCNCTKQWTDVVPHEEPFFLPPVRWVGYREAEVWLDPMPSANIDVGAAPHNYFCV